MVILYNEIQKIKHCFLLHRSFQNLQWNGVGLQFTLPVWKSNFHFIRFPKWCVLPFVSNRPSHGTRILAFHLRLSQKSLNFQSYRTVWYMFSDKIDTSRFLNTPVHYEKIFQAPKLVQFVAIFFMQVAPYTTKTISHAFPLTIQALRLFCYTLATKPAIALFSSSPSP